MNRRRITLAGAMLALVLLAATPGVSIAQIPIYKPAGEATSMELPKVVPDAEVSYSYYAELTPDGADVYQVWARAGQTLRASLLLPKDDSLKGWTPTMAVIGPGIEADGPHGGMPVEAPEGAGVHVVRYEGDTQNRPTEYEPFTMTSYWKGQEYRSTFPRDSPYWIVVWDDLDRGGKYVLVVGEKEEFGLIDWVKFPYTWAKVNLWLGNWLPVLIAGAVVFLILLIVLRLLLRKRTPVQPAE